MIFSVLGCSGSELGKDHPCSFLISDFLAVDMGCLASQLSLEEQLKITDVVLSHGHLDHIKDLAFFAENVFSLVQHPISIHGTKKTLDLVRKHVMNGKVWPDFSSLSSSSFQGFRYQEFSPGEAFRIREIELLGIPVKHSGGCVALFFRSPSGATLVYSGDTRSTRKMWTEVNQRGSSVKAILLECSFPGRFSSLALTSDHHTPISFEIEISKIQDKTIPVYYYHLKSPFRDEIEKELQQIQGKPIFKLEPGMKLEF